MYRRLVLTLMGMLLAGIILWAYLGAAGPYDSHLQWVMAQLQSWGVFRFRSSLGLAVVSLLQNLVGCCAVLLLARLGVFSPARRPSVPGILLRYAVTCAALAYTVFFLYDTMQAAGALAALYGRQTGQTAALVMLAALPHKLLEVAALALVLAAPVFVLTRSLQVLSLRQASFEGWLELRRRWRWALALLVAAALVEVYVTPASMAFLLR